MSELTPSSEGGLRERIALATLSVPFRVKVALVWLGIIGFLAIGFMFARFDVAWIETHLELIARGLKWTLILAVGGITLAIVMACLGALARTSRNPVAYGIAGFYTSFFRGTPLLVQISLLYLAVPQIARNLMIEYPNTWGTPFQERFGAPLIDFATLEPITVGIVALGLNYGAYMTEIFRAGIESIDGGQTEAAEALGLTYLQRMRKVILPQAVRVVIPPTGNEFIAMMKDTALISFIGATVEQAEIYRLAQLYGKADFKNLEALLVAASMYWAMTIIFSYLQGFLERYMARAYVRTGGAAVRGGMH